VPEVIRHQHKKTVLAMSILMLIQPTILGITEVVRLTKMRRKLMVTRLLTFLGSDFDNQAPTEEQNSNANNPSYMQGTLDAAYVLAGGFFASNDTEVDNNITSEVNDNNVYDTGSCPCPGLIGRDADGR